MGLGEEKKKGERNGRKEGKVVVVRI